MFACFYICPKLMAEAQKASCLKLKTRSNCRAIKIPHFPREASQRHFLSIKFFH